MEQKEVAYSFDLDISHLTYVLVISYADVLKYVIHLPEDRIIKGQDK